MSPFRNGPSEVHRWLKTRAGTGLVGPRGLEPRTSPLSGVRSHHLS